MSEQGKAKNRSRASDAPSRRAARSEDELRIYGDGESSAARARRRNEKTPPRARRGRPGRRGSRPKGLAGLYAWLIETRRDGAGKGLRIFGLRVNLPALIVSVVVLLLVSVTFLENRNLNVDEETVTIVGLASELEGYRILQLSDLKGRRFGDKQSTLLRAIDTLDYDVVFMTGDMVGPGGDPAPFYELLEGIPARKNVYFIAGDSDPSPYARAARGDSGTLSTLVLSDWVLGAVERGAVYVDAPVQVSVGSSSYWLTPAALLNLNISDTASTWKEQVEEEQAGVVNGIQADYDTLPFTSYRYEAVQRSLAAVNSMSQTDLHISLSHVPPTEAFVRASYSHDDQQDKYLTQPELILAGHYCGGVWRLPFIGAFYIPNSAAPRYGWFPAQDSVAGLSAIGETQVYVTTGLSTCSDAPLMFFRLFNRPQISLLTLTATLPAEAGK